MTEKRFFALKTVVLTSLITFMISGMGGAAISTWLDRAKPVVIIDAVGFSGSSEAIAIGDSLRDRVKESSWVPSVKNFEHWRGISERYELAQRIRKRLEVGIELSEAWLKQNEASFNKPNSKLTFDELSEYPYMIDEIIGSTLVGLARRGEISNVPVSPIDMASLTDSTQLQRNNDGWLLYMKTQNVAVPDDDAKTEVEQRHIETLAKSLSKGVGPNLVYYIRRFLENANREARHLLQLEQALQSALYPQTRLSAKITVFNSGKSPIVLKPFSLLTVLNEDVHNGQYVMAGVSNSKGGGVALTEILNEPESRDVEVLPFLPSTEERQYILVPPQGQTTIRLESLVSLAGNGERLRQIYDLNVLRCKITFSTLTGRLVESRGAVFGKTVSTEMTDELMGRAG